MGCGLFAGPHPIGDAQPIWCLTHIIERRLWYLPSRRAGRCRAKFMIQSKLPTLAALVLLMLLTVGCTAASSPQETDDAVASADEMAEVADVVEAGMTPINGAQVKDGVYSVTVVQQILEVPVFSAALRCTFHNGVLTRIEGTAYFDTTGLVRTDDVTCCTAADALVAFLGARSDLGWVGASVTAVTQGYYRAETASAAVVRLVPGWRIATDTGEFWVNGIDRHVSALSVDGG